MERVGSRRSEKLPLAAFLKYLTSSPRSPMTMSQAIKAAGPLIRAGKNSRDQLEMLTQVDMARIGIEDEDVRKGIMILTGKEPKGSSSNKRKRGSDLDRPLPSREVKQVVTTDLDFEEILAEEALVRKSCLVNRAPVMTAWATIVAERLGFRRQEALSIAQVYTDLNASQKGVSLGIMDPSVLKKGAGPSQPHVDLMGRQVPVLSMQEGEWRAISKGAIVEPSAAFSYMQRSFRQQLGAVLGALRLLAESFPPEELNQKGYGLYLDFRPNSDGWGKKAEMQLGSILDLRRFLTHKEKKEEEKEANLPHGAAVKVEEDVCPFEGDLSASLIDTKALDDVKDELHDSSSKRTRLDAPLPTEELDEFDVALADDDDFDYSAIEA